MVAEPGIRLWALLSVAVLLLTGCASAERLAFPEVRYAPLAADDAPACRERLRVMTLNIAHGRGEGFHQMLQKRETRLRNLDRVRELLDREQPDLVAVQEVDAPSFWSGGMHQLEYLAADRLHHVHGEHVNGPGLSYGNGLLASIPLSEPQTVTFDPESGHPAKGFLVSSFVWPGSAGIEVDVASLHLNPLSAKVRRAQAEHLVEILRPRGRPLILMGDFNTDWQRRNSSLRWIAEQLGLQPFRPEAAELISFPALERRLDWILVSPELEFHGYRVLPDAVSDHRPVVAELGLIPADDTGRELVANTGCAPE